MMPLKGKRRIAHIDEKKVRSTSLCEVETMGKTPPLGTDADAVFSAAFMNGDKKAMKRIREDDNSSNEDNNYCEIDENTTLEELGRKACYTYARPPVGQKPYFLLSAAEKQGHDGESALIMNMPAASSFSTALPPAQNEVTGLLQGVVAGGAVSLSNNSKTALRNQQGGVGEPLNGDCSGVALSPLEKSSAALIRKVASTRPAASPETMWIYIDDDDEVKVMSQQSFLPLTASNTANDAMDSTIYNSVSSPRRCVCHQMGHEPIAERLPPAFCPRKGQLQLQKPPLPATNQLSNNCLIYDDDVTDPEEEQGEGSRNANYFSKNLSFSSSFFFPEKMGRGDCSSIPDTSYLGFSRNQSGFSIIDDDKSDCSNNGDRRSCSSENQSNILCKEQKGDYYNIEKETEVTIKDGISLDLKKLPESSLCYGGNLSYISNNATAENSTQSVRDVIHLSFSRLSTDCPNFSFSSFAGISTPACGDEEKDIKLQNSFKRLKRLFDRRTSRRSFSSAVESVISKPYCLQPGEFWNAFKSVKYIGEGSFGIVWRCETVDGHVVAVKSCPISLRSCGSVEDSFSVLREIAVMRFLNENEVPYILPLYGAFFVEASEALPPDVVAAVKLNERTAMMEKADEEQQKKKQKNIEGDDVQAKKGRLYSMKWNKTKCQYLKNKQEKTKYEIDTEKDDDLTDRSRYDAIRLPRFLSISSEDAMSSDSTVFLVTEICDGDVENIERHDTIIKGAVFSVTSALSAMHQLGILHLDLKPSNILFVYENSLTQGQVLQQKEQKLQQGLLSSSSFDGIKIEAPNELSTTPHPLAASATGIHKAGSVRFYLSDFGNCRIVGPGKMDKVKDVFGTFEYMDSMALQYKTCSRATDCFSLGATLYELLYSKRLYPPCNNPECDSEEDHTQRCYIEAALRPVVPPPLPCPSPSATFLQKIMMGLLDLDPKKRWTAEQCRSLFLVNNIGKEVNIT